MSAALAVQKAIRARLAATAGVTDLVPASAILDRNQRPAPDPSIIIGEAQTVDPGTDYERRHMTVFHDLHVWKREIGTTGANAIAGAIRAAIHAGRLVLDDGWHCADARVSDVRVMRDPDGETAHAVVTVEALVAEVAS